MKFELTAPGKQVSDQELINDLKNVAQALQKDWLTQKEYDSHGNYSYQTQKKRFGSWLKALENAGLNQSKRPWGGELEETSIPENLLFEDLNRVAELLNKKAITLAEYEEHGRYGTATISKRYGGWNNAKIAAGLKVGRAYNTTDEEYFENILNLWEHFGRQPKYREVEAPVSKLHISSYERKFGSWRNALEAFVNHINKQEDTEAPTPKTDIKPIDINKTSKPTKTENTKKRTNRIANLRQRFRVMKRDGFKCVLCGASPATNPGCELHIDHITPWSHGGETVEENLRTLCSHCNLGRSNKE